MKIHRVAAFTENSVGGNPAGVVLSRDLPEVSEMQRVATDVGYSETVFSAPQAGSWRTRYFSPKGEVEFCGHATIALGAVLASEEGDGTFKLVLNTGNIEVTSEASQGTYRSTLRSPPTRNAVAADAVVQEALGVFGYSSSEINPDLPPMVMNAGNDHLLLCLNSRDQLASMKYDLAQGEAFMRRHGFVTVALVWRESNRIFHARNAFASGGVIEDPATGAAAAALAGMLRDRGVLSDGELIILQGFDMGSPSRIGVHFEHPKGSPVFVSGTTKVIA